MRQGRVCHADALHHLRMSRLCSAPSNLNTTPSRPAPPRHGSLRPSKYQTQPELRFPSEPRATVLTLRFTGHRDRQTLRPRSPER